MRRIIGIQTHHSVNLEDASRFGVNMLTALEAAFTRTGDPEIHQLLEGDRTLARTLAGRYGVEVSPLPTDT